MIELKFWNSPIRMKQAALCLLATAFVFIGVVVTAGQRMAAIQGPGTLGVVGDKTLWLVVNRDIWVLDDHGRRVGQRTVESLGLDTPPSNIIPMPDGNVLLASTGLSEWVVLDPKTLSRVRSVHAQWPSDLADSARALHLAISPSGTIAAGTGGGHTVLLFDADGRLLARTAPGTYRFTNGLRSSPEGWWTTDTNRSRIRLLDERTLQVKSSIEVPPTPAPEICLGDLVPSQGAHVAGDEPLVTLTKVGFLMQSGYIADVFPDGHQELYDEVPHTLRDIAWFGGELVATNGDTFELMRFGRDRHRIEPLGDAAIRAELREMRAAREFWTELSSRWALLGSILLLLLGVAAYSRHKRLAEAEMLEGREGVTEPPAPRDQRVFLQRLRIYGVPVVVRLAAFGVGFFVILPAGLVWFRHHAGASSLVRIGLAAACFLPLWVAAMWQLWRHDRLMRDPALEDVLNVKGHQWLHRYADWERVARPGEVPRESLFITGWNKRWLLLTNARILLFAASARERKLLEAWPRNDVVFAGVPESAPGATTLSLLRRIHFPQCNLMIAFKNGRRLKLRCASAVAGLRAARLMMGSNQAPAVLPMERRAGRPKLRWQEVVASFAVPGSGQWLQGRNS